MTKTVLITGATGKQGGAVVDHLLSADADVRILAVTRDTKSASAQRFAQKSDKITMVEGNMNDPATIFKNAKKATSSEIWGLFSVQSPWGKGQAPEEQQGKALIDESIKNGVKFFVYSSVDRGGDASYDNPTNIPHFRSKHNIEHYLGEKTQNGEMEWVILRPTAFFDNLVPGFVGRLMFTSIKLALKGKPLQQIAVSDIGWFAAQAFMKPAEYKGKYISLAGEELTYDQLAKVFKEKTGHDIPTTYHFLCHIAMWLSKDIGLMLNWFHDEGYKADIPALKRMHPGLKDFGTWLEQDSQFMSK